MALTAKKVYAILKRQISDMEAKLNSPVRYRGTVATADLLPLNPDIGDMYNIESKSVYGEAGMNVAWNGVVWDTMGAPIDMSLYLTKEEAEAVIQRLVTEYFEKNPVKPGATTEQALQIEQNKTDIASLKEETGSLKEDVANKITKFYANNLGEMHITDSDNGKIQDMQIFGRSEQKKYNGYQLLALAPINLSTGEKASLPYTEKGITVDIANDGIGYTVRGTNTLNEQAFDIYLSMPSAFDIEAGTYTRSGKIINGNSNVELVSGGGTSSGGCLEYRADKVDFTFTETVKKGKSGNFIIRISPSAKVNAIVYFQIEKGSEAHGFEPYVGGQPSPSPDYPQEIKNVVNPTVKVCGKNLWNPILGGYISGIDGSIVAASKKQIAITDFIKTSGKDITVIARNFSSAIERSYAYRIGFYNAEKKWIKNAILSDGNKHSINTFNITGTEYIRVSAPSGIYDTIQIEYGSEATPYEPYTEQSVQLPYTLNAIPITSGGNVTIDGQQYIADYVDVERGKLVKMVDSSKLDNTQSIVNKTEWLLAEQQETDLTTEQTQALKALATYYPTTNISVNSEQLDGYTVFNYPISMKNGWDYVKKQLNDNRDYIYDMDTQSAEAYVNSEYAVALTELEV